MSQTTIQLGNRIRRLRQARDWSQEQLAEYADLSLSYIALLENGHSAGGRKAPSGIIRRLSRHAAHMHAPQNHGGP